MRVSLRLMALMAAVAVGYFAADRLIPVQAQGRGGAASFSAVANDHRVPRGDGTVPRSWRAGRKT